ncbi:MAG: VanW family protein [Patescibacteria group bacterium]|nr:VanW family protein [Patescibacteria group bacterium]
MYKASLDFLRSHFPQNVEIMEKASYERLFRLFPFFLGFFGACIVLLFSIYTLIYRLPVSVYVDDEKSAFSQVQDLHSIEETVLDFASGSYTEVSYNYLVSSDSQAMGFLNRTLNIWDLFEFHMKHVFQPLYFETEKQIVYSNKESLVPLHWERYLQEKPILYYFEEYQNMLFEDIHSWDYFLLQVSEKWEKDPQNVFISQDPDTENLSFSSFALSGDSVAKMETKGLLLQGKEKSIPFVHWFGVKKAPVVEVDQKVADMEVDTVLSTGVSDYSYSSWARQQNVFVGLSKFQGKILQPGETLSVVDAVAPVTPWNGYHKEDVIKGDILEKEYGGGLCQVSSTVYRGAMLAGLSIPQRKSHGYMIFHYTPPGSDATIYMPRPDLQITNDMETPIIIQTHYDPEKELAYVNYYGKSDGRKVELSGPYISDWKRAGNPEYIYTTALPVGRIDRVGYASPGFTATWTRDIDY